MRITAIITLALSSLLAACGSDDGGESALQLPAPGAGFGSNNSTLYRTELEQIQNSSGNSLWSQQDCSAANQGFSKRQSIRFYNDSDIEVVILAYPDQNWLEPFERLVYQGKFEIKGTSSDDLRNGDSAIRFEAIFTQATSTLLTKERVDARNGPSGGSGACDRQDWAIGKAIDISDYNRCFPLFPISERQQQRLVQNQLLSNGRAALFLDNPDKRDSLAAYPYQLDTTPFESEN